MSAEKDIAISALHATIAELRDELDGIKKKSSDGNCETITYGLQADLAGKKKPKKKPKAKGVDAGTVTAE